MALEPEVSSGCMPHAIAFVFDQDTVHSAIRPGQDNKQFLSPDVLHCALAPQVFCNRVDKVTNCLYPVFRETMNGVG